MREPRTQSPPVAGRTKKGRLRASRVLDVPLKEVSGICLHRGRKHRMALTAVGDRVATIAWMSLQDADAEPVDWRTTDVGNLRGSGLSEDDPQIEAVCADGDGRVLLLQESPPRAVLIDPERPRVVAVIALAVEGRDAIARSWSDPKGSRGEGVVFLPGGHLLIAKEKDPAALIEFGPAGSRPRGLVRGGALPDGARWPIGAGQHRFVALAVWRPDKALAKACEDFSDLDIGPDGRLYLLSDQSATIARLGDLSPGDGAAAYSAAWRLQDLKGKPEGLAFTAEGRAIVALDKRKPRRNLVVLDPPIAPPHGGAQA
jgi:hypothetical protein